VRLDIPISLSTERIQTREFKASVDIPYDIDIAFDSNIPMKELDCLVGMNSPSIVTGPSFSTRASERVYITDRPGF